MHIKQLDSLRGLASLIVLFGHYSVLFPKIREYFDNTFFALFFNGSVGVSFFFVLSGFVLSIRYFNGKDICFSVFIIKRFFRLYIPYLISFIFAILLYNLLSKNGIPELGNWFNGAWTTPLDFLTFIKHILFIINFDYGQYNPVYWTLVMEMRISIIFLLLVFFFRKYSSFINFLVWGLVVIIVLFFNKSFAFQVDYLNTFSFLLNFILGILLVKHREEIHNFYSNNNIFAKFIFILIMLFLLRYSKEILSYFSIYTTFTYYLLTGIGSSILIIYSLNSEILKNFLLFKIIHFIGKISYSLYLLHAIVLYSFIYLFYGYVNNYFIALLSFVFSIFLSYIFYTYVELKSINIGIKVINKYEYK